MSVGAAGVMRRELAPGWLVKERDVGVHGAVRPLGGLAVALGRTRPAGDAQLRVERVGLAAHELALRRNQTFLLSMYFYITLSRS